MQCSPASSDPLVQSNVTLPLQLNGHLQPLVRLCTIHGYLQLSPLYLRSQDGNMSHPIISGIAHDYLQL